VSPLFRRRRGEAGEPEAESGRRAPGEATDDLDPDDLDPDDLDPTAEDAADDDVDDADDDEGDDETTGPRHGLPARPDGPWDLAERPDAEGMVDLGALRLRGRDGMELRLEVEEATGAVTAATVQLAGSAVQLQAFAAPRSEGIWAEIRSEIAAGITRQGGTVDEVPGTFGRELIARIPVRTPDGRTGHQPARFTGVDGPRWFLRAVFHGPAVHDEEAAEAMESIVRDVVVVRGPDAMAPRDLLPLQLPDAAVPAPAEAEETDGRPPLEPFKRGPEITEIH
jgi:hypothetical protein